METHLHHADPAANPGIDLLQSQLEIGNFLRTLREINKIEQDIIINGPSDLKTLTQLGLIRELDLLRDSLLSPILGLENLYSKKISNGV